MKPVSITSIIPAYNEAGRVGKVIEEVLNHVGEVIVIDDHSRDETALEAEAAGARVVRQPSNRGYIAAIKRGFAEATGDIVVTIDADGEYPPDYIPDLVAPILEDRADMVQARRECIPRPSERLLTWLVNKKAFVGDSGTGFRALRTDLARKLSLNGMCICGIFSLEVALLGGQIAEVPVRLHKVNKPRRVAWFHLKQFFFLLPWLLRRPRQNN